MKKAEDVIGDYYVFLDKIFFNLKKSGFDFADFKELDHLGYRVEDNGRYEEKKREIRELADKESEVLIDDRLVSIFKLKEPLVSENFKISALELLAPKINNIHKEGLEHAEFVVKDGLDDFFEKYKEAVDFDLSKRRRNENPEIIVGYDGCRVKFHERSVLEIRGL
jgi:predicted metalloenzyme YecM